VIALSFNWDSHLFWIHYGLAELLFDGGRFDDAHQGLERAKSHTINNPYQLGHAMRLQAQFWWRQSRFEEARSEVLRAADVYEKLGAAREVGDCRALLRKIEEGAKNAVISGG